MILSWISFHSVQVQSPTPGAVTVGSLNSSYSATVGSSLYRFATVRQNLNVSSRVVTYIGDVYFSSFRLPMECQSMMTYRPCCLAQAIPWSIAWNVSSQPREFKFVGWTANRTTFAPQSAASAKYRSFHCPSRTSFTGSEKQRPRNTSSFPSGSMNLFPFTRTRPFPAEQETRMISTAAPTRAITFFLFIVNTFE